jgi:hypothetical protein
MPMLIESTTLSYSIATILSNGKKNFKNMGRSVGWTDKAISNSLPSTDQTRKALQTISESVFASKNKLYLSVDETLIKKKYAAPAQGSGLFFDSGSRAEYNGYKLITGLLSDGQTYIPTDCNYLFANYILKSCKERFPNKTDFVKHFYMDTARRFHKQTIVLVADGHYATVEILSWCLQNNIPAEMRMHSNRVVKYQGKEIKLSELLELPGMKPSKRRMARTIKVEWHGLSLWITIERRIDKHGEESFVFLVSTYKAEPRVHVKTYKRRWPSEKKYRTSKQSLGLGDCQSRKLATQHKHSMSVLLAYAITQLERLRHRFKNAEEAIRSIREKCETLVFSEAIDLIGSLMT